MENKITINELMALMKVVRSRHASLSRLRDQVSTKERYFGAAEKVVEPQYDVKLLDKQIAYLDKFLFLADSKIKTTNAKTVIDMNYDLDALLSPID